MFDIKVDLPSAALALQRKEIRKALRQAGKEVSDAAKALIRSGAHGRQYGTHTASAPGEAPASRTGNLARSLAVVPVSGRNRMAVKVAGRAFYALALEAGAHTESRDMEPRPFLSKALEANREQITRRLQEAIEKDIEFKSTK